MNRRETWRAHAKVSFSYRQRNYERRHSTGLTLTQPGHMTSVTGCEETHNTCSVILSGFDSFILSTAAGECFRGVLFESGFGLVIHIHGWRVDRNPASTAPSLLIDLPEDIFHHSSRKSVSMPGVEVFSMNRVQSAQREVVHQHRLPTSLVTADRSQVRRHGIGRCFRIRIVAFHRRQRSERQDQ